MDPKNRVIDAFYLGGVAPNAQTIYAESADYDTSGIYTVG